MTYRPAGSNPDQNLKDVAQRRSQLSQRLPAQVLAGFALLVAAAVLYAFTLDNGLAPSELVGGDLITHQYAQVQARPSNAPGYPIYTMGGWLWFHGLRWALESAGFSKPNPIPILSSYSTLWALAALWLLYEIISRMTASERHPSGNWPVALAVSAFYAVTYFFWYYATTTEQYSSAVAQTLAIVFVLVLWLRSSNRLSLLYLLAFLSGLSLAHMLTVAFIVPPVVVAVIQVDPSLLRNPKAILGSLTAALLPLLSYVFVYVRGAQHPEWWGRQHYDSAADWFWDFVSTSQGREELMWAFEPGRPFLGNGFPELIGQELTWAMLLAGLAGIAFLRRPLPMVLYATLAIYLAFSWVYRFGNWFQVILPAYALLMIGFGSLADRWQRLVIEWSRPSRPSSVRRVAGPLLVATPILIIGLTVVWRFNESLPAADSRNRPGSNAFERAAVLLDGPLPTNSALFASVEDALALQYLTRIWGLRPDLRVISSIEAAAMLDVGPVYSTKEAVPTLVEELDRPGALQVHVVTPDWVRFRAKDTPTETAEMPVEEPPAVVVNERISDELLLDGYTVTIAPDGDPVVHTAQPKSDLILYWHLPGGEWPEGLSISVRPTVGGEFVADTRDPAMIVQIDRTLPTQLTLQQSIEADRITVADPYRVPFPVQSDADERGVTIILYRQSGSGFENIARFDLPLEIAPAEE